MGIHAHVIPTHGTTASAGPEKKLLLRMLIDEKEMDKSDAKRVVPTPCSVACICAHLPYAPVYLYVRMNPPTFSLRSWWRPQIQ